MIPPWPPSHALLCLVTDRHALGAAVGSVDPFAALRQQLAAAVDAGVDLIHVRERDLEAGRLRDLVGECAELARGSDTRVVVNDRVDVGLAAGAAGVHLRGDSIEAARLKPALPSGFLLGQSIRHAAAASAPGVDYFVLGTIYPTPSKPGGETLVGLDELSRAARGASAPVLGIGGIGEDRLVEVARAGAAGFAAIRLFFGAPGEWSSLRGRVARWRQAFDTNRTIA